MKITPSYLERLHIEDLQRLFLTTRIKLKKLKDKNMANKDIEIDMCYIQHELQERHKLDKDLVYKEYFTNKK